MEQILDYAIITIPIILVCVFFVCGWYAIIDNWIGVIKGRAWNEIGVNIVITLVVGGVTLLPLLIAIRLLIMNM